MKITPAENAVSVILSGEMFAEEAAKFHAEVLKYCEKGFCHFHIDMSDLTYIDSSGLGALVALYKKTAERGGKVRLYGLKGDVKQLFELTSLNKVFDTCD